MLVIGCVGTCKLLAKATYREDDSHRIRWGGAEMRFPHSLAFLFTGIALLAAMHASAIEYNVPEPAQNFPGSGWLTEAGNYHGIKFKAYLERKQLLIRQDGIYYIGTQRVEGIDGDPHGKIRWYYLARCASPPGNQQALPPALWSSDQGPILVPSNTDFLEIDVNNPTPANAMKGWYNLWWAVCRNEARSFDG